MSLRAKFILYIILMHALFAGVAVYLLIHNRLWLLLAEAVFVVSLVCGLKLVSSFFGTLELIKTGAQFISDNDFTSRFREVGQLEMDLLINIYNRMVDNLREERAKSQEQNYFLEKVLTASPSGIITLDFDEKIAMVNPAAERMLQAAKEVLTGHKLSEINTPFASDIDHLKPGESKVVPLLGRRRVKCRKSQFLDRGFVRHFILMEELTEELRQSEKVAYEKLIRMMSHEVNNTVGAANSLLHSCLTYGEQLDEEDREDHSNALGVVISRTSQLNLFMKSFADVIRLPAPTLHPCDLQELLGGISLLMREECVRRDIYWNWDVQKRFDPISIDRSQIEQVFVNIFKNAIEAIGENGVITVRLFEKSSRPFAVIEDTGCGISEEVRANLFTPFFSTKDNGQGIGLTLVQEILDRHGFEFSLEGIAGQSTQFTICFDSRLLT